MNAAMMGGHAAMILISDLPVSPEVRVNALRTLNKTLLLRRTANLTIYLTKY